MKDNSPFVFVAYGKAGKFQQTTNGCIPVRSSLANQTSLCGKSTPGCPQYYRKSTTMLGYRVKPGKEVLVPFPADRMKAWPIDARMNSPKNNDPDILRPTVE